MRSDARPLSIAIAALGGQGGGVLADWLLAVAERPMMLVGGSGWSDDACRNIAAFAQANDLPVCCSFRRQDIVDNRLGCFVGDLGTGASPSLVARCKEADLLLAVGARIGEITSQSYTLLGIPDPGKVLIHVHTAAEELGRVQAGQRAAA